MTDTVASTTPASPSGVAAHAHPGAEDTDTGATNRRDPWFGPLLRRLHFYAGILVGPFILVAATSGALYALTPMLEQVVYDHELHAPVSSTQLSLGDQVEVAQGEVGDDAMLSAVRPAPEPGDTTRVMFSEDGLAPSESRAVFVDPGTGEVRGDLTVYGTSGSLPMRTWIDTLHRSLHLGDPGRVYSELAASWLGIVVAAGLVMWLVRFRKTRKKADLVRPNPRYTGYRRTFGWHTSVGIWVALGALFLSATGITWSQFAGSNVGDLRAAIGGGTPAISTSLSTGTDDDASPGGGKHAEHEGMAMGPGSDDGEDISPAAFDGVLSAAQRVNINTGLVEIKPPAEPGTAWTVTEIKRTYPTEGDAVAVDGSTMEVVDRTDFATFPLLAKLSSWGIALHMGTMFGVANQLVLFVLALGIGAMVLLGYLMWWKRRPTREPRRPMGPPPRRGVLRGAPWWGVAAVVAGAVAIGWFLPLVGYTLAAFVVLDVAIGFVSGPVSRSRRSARP